MLLKILWKGDGIELDLADISGGIGRDYPTFLNTDPDFADHETERRIPILCRNPDTGQL
ncbi:unnamed protein product [Meloidogyne enterolobii]|uniref:Uncharacterized protein n=1 Tax=Meloidogyne enterolobii TaxID=390850 RepID=A0ACB0Y389_MELEN